MAVADAVSTLRKAFQRETYYSKHRHQEQQVDKKRNASYSAKGVRTVDFGHQEAYLTVLSVHGNVEHG